MMNRRQFLNRVVGGTVAAAWTGSLQPLAAFRSPPSTRRLIIPTDTPDRFGLKVMEFNPIPAPDPETWDLRISGLAEHPLKLKLADLRRLPQVTQNSRLKCVQCWSGRVLWEGFRCGELLRLAQPKPTATWVRIDCADLYYDYVKMEDFLHARTLFALKMNREPLTPEHGAPLRLVMPFKYGYKSSKLITKITLTDRGGQGVVADTWPFYSQTGDIEPGQDHPFDFPGETRKIRGGEILEY
jgi:methionine sulfoxide reductase catalytic subunit